MKRILYAMSMCLLLAPASAALAAEQAPDALVKSTVDDVLAAIKQSKDKRALRELAEQKVLPNFDFKQMTQLAVGRPWREASAAQQQALEDGFRSLLVNTYVNALSQVTTSAYSFEVKPLQAQPQQSDVTVRTLVREQGKQPVTIDYRLANTSGGWKVYDVSVENLSLVTNYRGSFAGEINRSGIDGLIKALDAKNRTLAQG